MTQQQPEVIPAACWLLWVRSEEFSENTQQSFYGPYGSLDQARDVAAWISELFPGLGVYPVPMWAADPAVISIVHRLTYPTIS